MTNTLVVRTQRYKKIGGKISPLVYILEGKPRDMKMYDLKRIAEEIKALGGMSVGDALHMSKAIARDIRERLTDGDSVRLDDFGTFRTSFHCMTTKLEKDCTVKNIDEVRVNFKVADTLRLMNDSVVITKGTPNSITYELVSAGDGSSSDGTDSPPDDREEEDPLG